MECKDLYRHSKDGTFGAEAAYQAGWLREPLDEHEQKVVAVNDYYEASFIE